MATGTDESKTSSETTSDATTQTTTGSEYSVTDPGYDSGLGDNEDRETTLAALKAENTKSTSSDEETSTEGDEASSETDAGTEETTSEESDSEESTDDAADESQFSDELLDRAVALGYTLDDLKSFSDAKALEKDIKRVERFNERLQAKKPTESDGEPEPEAEQEPNWDKMVEDGHDPETVKLHRATWERAAKAEAKLNDVVKAESQRAWEAHCERFDAALDKLGEDYKPLFGTGRRGEIAKTSPDAARNRDKVFEMTTILRNGYVAAGRPVPPEAELINEAVQASFWRQSQTIARNKLKGDIKKSSSQSLSRPRSAGKSQLVGAERALEKEREFWKSHS